MATSAFTAGCISRFSHISKLCLGVTTLSLCIFVTSPRESVAGDDLGEETLESLLGSEDKDQKPNFAVRKAATSESKPEAPAKDGESPAAKPKAVPSAHMSCMLPDDLSGTMAPVCVYVPDADQGLSAGASLMAPLDSDELEEEGVRFSYSFDSSLEGIIFGSEEGFFNGGKEHLAEASDRPRVDFFKAGPQLAFCSFGPYSGFGGDLLSLVSGVSYANGFGDLSQRPDADMLVDELEADIYAEEGGPRRMDGESVNFRALNISPYASARRQPSWTMSADLLDGIFPDIPSVPSLEVDERKPRPRRIKYVVSNNPIGIDTRDGDMSVGFGYSYGQDPAASMQGVNASINWDF